MKFLCPECRLPLEERNNCLVCQCGNIYQIIDGIPIFSKIDPFYEGTWAGSFRESRTSFGSFFYLNFSRDTFPTRYRFLRKCLKDCSSFSKQFILDLGCGGGKEILSKKGTAVGADISITSLKNAKSIYHQCVQTNITKPLPFEDETFDFVYSDEVLEHIPHKNKDNLIEEVYRVLKKDGKALFIFETLGIFHRLAKLKSDCYKKYFVERQGHFGLEYSQEAIERFRRNGFRISKIEKHFSLFFPIGMLLEYLDNEYRRKSVILDEFLEMIKFISKFPRLAEIINFCTGSLQEILEAFLPVSAGSSLFILCKKRT